ncbi:hypothetical protein BDB00DRAFT_817903 [Zychaea mexicana]|uniref:uncharacterized protein n=1 Tax=Zychaea mexicana TaxID=64656 RepID=UPI0022FDF327|nr:uncharacterized protein BDB00DRAFT_817903 [Zychaea mexicana]KAI9494702.1 hypothetical protein BDB00DRAFT_817903 [Zychaea mexicana]
MTLMDCPLAYFTAGLVLVFSTPHLLTGTIFIIQVDAISVITSIDPLLYINFLKIINGMGINMLYNLLKMRDKYKCWFVLSVGVGEMPHV